jgi:excinuclease ABC subunit A
VLNKLVDTGNTVLLIEHNLDVIKQADWIIDLGPEGGDRGGQVIATGTPEQVASVPHSYTGHYLRTYLAEGLATLPTAPIEAPTTPKRRGIAEKNAAVVDKKAISGKGPAKNGKAAKESEPVKKAKSTAGKKR